VLFYEMQQRYITNFPSASWMSVVLSGSSATKADDDQWVFEELFAQNPVQLVILGDAVKCRPIP
jgi:hypothetical protein